ncbi:MAG: glutamate-1-semialdehyde 2,1-aminomutase [Bdellovibrionaceae bacterium]|nr:glutamate-1-semialdehyde 2,1-aminomutase [Pseudobdellovibrionaceae bacterium]
MDAIKSSAKSSVELFERAKKVAPGGVHSPVRSFKGLGRSPVFFLRSEGPYLWSVEGDRYIDFCQSFGPLILGHRDPEVTERVRSQIDLAWTFGACEPYSLELAEWITSRIPSVEKLRFVSSGTEAVMSALRLARAYTQRNKILKFEGCYHGHVDGLLVKAGSGLAGESAASSAGISEGMARETLVVDLNSEAQLEAVFKTHRAEIAVVVIEPLPANYGLLVQRKEFVLKIQELAKRHGALFMVDEVISGFRVGIQGMIQDLGLNPDLVCYGKILGGGFPVGCYGGRKEIMDFVAPLGPVYQAGTLSANPVGMVAGLATLQKMESTQGWAVLNARSSEFCGRLKALLNQHSDLDVTTYASLFWIHTKASEPIRSLNLIPKGQGEIFKSMFLKLLDKGVYLAPNAYEVGFLSLAHTDAVLEETLGKIKGVLI